MTAEGGVEGRLIERAEAALTGMEAFRALLEARTRDLGAMGDRELKATGLDTLLRDLSKALTVAIVEEGKVADAIRHFRGGDGLDLDAARASLGSKLDRLAERLAEG